MNDLPWNHHHVLLPHNKVSQLATNKHFLHVLTDLLLHLLPVLHLVTPNQVCTDAKFTLDCFILVCRTGLACVMCVHRHGITGFAVIERSFDNFLLLLYFSG